MTSSDSEDRELFRSVATPRVFEEIVDQVKKALFSKQLLPGDKLPPERELTRQFGASRAAVREALRVLESSGFIRMRTGKEGGAYVAEAHFQPVTDAVQNMLHLQEIGVSDLYSVRKMIEPSVAELAAARATPEQLASLEDNICRAHKILGDGGVIATETPEFHVLLAGLAGNRLLEMLTHVFEQLQTFYPATEEISAVAVADHEALLEAMRLKDLPLVRRLMTEHLDKLEVLLLNAQREEVELDGHR